jgi:recombinational DNA repair ATPase RecF
MSFLRLSSVVDGGHRLNEFGFPLDSGVALASISLRGLRNLGPTALEFDRGANYLFGPNGAGKTNLLEAIHYLAIGRSFRRCPDVDLLGFGKDVLVVSGTDASGERAEIRSDGREKRLLRNDIPVERLSEYFGWLPVVVLLLEDIELVRGAPGIRRSFLDLAIAKAQGGRLKTGDWGPGAQQAKSEGRSQKPEGRSHSSPPPSPPRGEGERSEGEEAVGGPRSAESEGRMAHGDGRTVRQGPLRPSEVRSYIALMAEYRRAVAQYNRLLERGARGEGRGMRDEIAAWEEEVARTGAPVYEARMARVGELLEDAARHYERLTGQGAVFSYRASIVPPTRTGDSPSEGTGPRSGVEDAPRVRPQRGQDADSPRFAPDSRDLAEAFRERLAKTRERALALGHALVGPHRDDIRIARGDRELRKFGSVGEQRLAGIALRLAEADMILSTGRQEPVFLLDEVASELDEQRSRLVLEMVAERGQMVYAAARRIVRREVRSPDDEGRIEDSVRDVGPAFDHLTTGPLDHFCGKEFHVEAGKVSEVP